MDLPTSPVENEALLKRAGNPGFLWALADFLWNSRKWWMLPLILMLIIMGVALGLVNTAAAPFIYTLF
jgi:uncharacterized membrane protein YqhA